MTIRKTEINEKSQAVVEFSFDAAAIEAEKAKVFRKKANSFNVPGFRRGKAPRSVIEKMYGTGIFLEDAINELINANWEEIINAAGKTIVSSPEFDIVSFEDEEILQLDEIYGVTPLRLSDENKTIHLIFAACCSAIIIIKHLDNFVRLLDGSEPKLSFGKKKE